MSKSKKNGIATAADARAAAARWASEQFEDPEDVKLPVLGITVRLRRPKPVYFAVMGLPLPQSLASKADKQALTPEELLKLADLTVKLLTGAFVSPKLSLSPGPDEIDPNLLLPDYPFLVRYLIGEVLAGGQDLKTFRDGAAGGSAAAGPDGGADGLPGKRPAVRRDRALPN